MADTRRQNKRTVRRLFDEVIDGQEYNLIPRYCAADVVMHRPGDAVVTGREAYERHYRQLHAAFPDFDATLTDLVGDAERVATRFTVTGTHEGEILGVAPTGRQVEFPAQIVFRLDEGTVTEEFHQSDRDSLRAQLAERE